MAQYDNLKDYFQEEHIDLITSAIEEHLKNEVKSCRQIKAPVVRSLVCINDDAQFNVEIELGISANIVVEKKNCSRSFIITLTGNLEQKFKDINVIAVRSINEDEFPKDNLLWQFILPDLPDSELERIGNELFYCYDENVFFTDDKLCIQSLKAEGMLYFAPLDQNIMGQIILSESVCEIIHNVQTEHGLMPKIENIRASYGRG